MMLNYKSRDQKFFLAAAAFSGFLNILLGAVGRHALNHNLSTDMVATFETGLRYQMFHSLALLLVNVMERGNASSLFSKISWSFFLGILFFCGGIYAYAFSGFRVFAFITPLGGIFFLAGWLILFIASLKR